uniref:Orotate phosphoribosyltransferase n=1 Tax=uncultured marine thaumarchaeote KM3_16_G02 TaxID=1456045 RepID=A0A075GJB3_9ARCH|nr:orotate phosphoribosyltransferase (pyrE) [uncultured marine thaumarchaeote KM3_16_G02]
MGFVKEFATFLYEKKIIRFGDFTLASGVKSPYYIDLRLVPSFPHEYRKMIKGLQNLIAEDIGFEDFHSLVSVPTGGLIVAASLATEIVKPLIYVRKQAKEHGTGKAVEGVTCQDMKLLMIEDVVTSGGSIISAIKSIKEEKMVVTDAYAIVDRMEGATQALQVEGVNLHSLLTINDITQSLFEQKLITQDVLKQVQDRIK